MRTSSHIDFHTAVKMNQLQSSTCSEFPPRTPLPSYSSQITEECYSYPSSCDQNLINFTRALGSNTFPVSGPLTLQTPEPIIYHEPLSMGGLSDQWMAAQSWSDDSLVAAGPGFEEMAAMLPTELWPPFGHAQTAPVIQMPWYQSSLSASPRPILSELVPDARAVPSLSISECSIEDINNSGIFLENWIEYQPITTPLDMSSLVSASFVHNIASLSCVGPMWEDAFSPGTTPY
ncbi:hypothetical protein GQ44DRAFT_615310 [Phaeosphaeriaceae sp. PMI808]|nr:hypothetical protein GQ44DRAFT_615310 [Phaeosphaeriaceae sp. PMI808]